MAHEIENIRKKRKQKRKKKLFKKLSIVILVFLAAFGIINSKDNWMPHVNSFFYSIRNIFNKDNKDITINFDESNINHIFSLNDKLVLLTDSKTYFYNRDLKVSNLQNHNCSDPVMSQQGDNVVLYDLNGYFCTVYSRSKELYTIRTDEKIMFVDLSEKGYSAVVSASDTDLISLSVYNNKGKKIFYTVLDEKIIDVAFNGNSSGCVVSTISTKVGKITTKVYSFNFKKNKVLYTSEVQDNLSINSIFTSNNNLAMIGNKGYNILKGLTGENKFSYQYEGDLTAFDTKGDNTAVVLYNKERRLYQLVVFDNDKKTGDVSLENQVIDAYINESKVYLLTPNSFLIYSLGGNLEKTIALDTKYSEIAVIDNHAFLLGVSQITRINLDK